MTTDVLEQKAREWLDTQDECRRAIRDADWEVLAAFAFLIMLIAFGLANWGRKEEKK